MQSCGPIRMAFAVVAICAMALVSADGDGVQSLQGEEEGMPLGWIRTPQKLGESAGQPSTYLSSSTSFSGAPAAADYIYKMTAGGAPTEALKELSGEMLMGEGMDDDEDASRVTISGLQAHLEGQADMMGKVSRLTAVKVLLAMPAARRSQDVETAELIQVGAGAGWGRRRRGSEWEQNPIVQAQKQQEKAEAKKEGQHGDAQQPAKVVVRKPAATEEAAAAAPGNEMDEAKAKADKAIEMAQEKGDKATAKAEEEARAAQKEADDKKAFELAEKRKHELTNKEEQVREKKIKEETERSKKKAKEASVKAEGLQKAVAKAKEAADKQQVVEGKMKKAKEGKQKKDRKVMIEKAKEKAAKNTKEAAEKKMQELKAKNGNEGAEKKEQEKQLKHKHELSEKKIDEQTKKKTTELARKTAEEAKNKDSEEKQLKAADEKKMKAAMENRKKAEEERNDKAKKENNEKKKRETALKTAAKRRIEEEQAAKAEKRKAMESSAEMATKKAKELEKKSDEEKSQKQKEEVELKKTREKKEKDAREVTAKKAEEIQRKTHREHKDKTEQEKSAKEFEENNHKEKQKKANERTKKILEGLKDFEESLAKARQQYEEKNKVFREIEPVESKHKTDAGNLSRIAKELAQKIKGDKEEEKSDVCDLGTSLENIKKKGLLKANEGDCSVVCSVKPSDLGVQVQCKLDGTEHGNTCKKLMYSRMQALSSSLLAEFDSYKRCVIDKQSKAAGADNAKLQSEGGEGPQEFRERMMLGEGENLGLQHAMPKKDTSDGVEVGEYIYALKDIQDVTGSVNVGQAMDLLMKCNRDHHGHGAKQTDELGDSYEPTDSESYNAGANGGGEQCMLKGIQGTIENIVGPPSDGCTFNCETKGVEFESYTAECEGSGNTQCFLSGTETYHRSVAASYLAWKTNCAAAHSDSQFKLW